MAELTTKIVITAEGSSASKAVEELRKKFGGLGQEGARSGQNAAAGLDAVADKARGLGVSLGRLTGLLPGLGVTISGGALVMLTRHAAAAADALQKMSQRVDFTVRSLSTLLPVLKLSGVEAGEFEMAMTRLGNAISGALDEDSKKATQTLNKLGVATLDAEGYIRPLDTILGDVAERFKEMPDGIQKTALASQVFGDRLGRNMIPFLNQGRDGIEAMRKEMRELGVELTGPQAQAAERLRDSFDKIGLAVQGIANRILVAFAPALTEMNEAMAQSVKDGGAVNRVLTALLVTVKTLALGAETLARFWYSVGVSIAGTLIAIGAAMKGQRQLARSLMQETGAEIERQLDALARRRAQLFGDKQDEEKPRGRERPSDGGGGGGKLRDGATETFRALQQEFDAQFRLGKDLLDREKQALEGNLRERLISIKAYFAERSRLADDELRIDLDRLNRERDFQQQQLTALAELRRRASPQQQAQIDAQEFTAKQKLREVETDIQIAQARRLQTARLAAVEQAAAERALADALSDVRDRLAEIEGRGADAARNRAQRQLQPLIEQLELMGDRAGAGDVRRLIDVEADLASLRDLEAQFNVAMTRMRNVEQSIQTRRQAGILTESQARRAQLDVQKLTADQLEGMIPKMEAFARHSDQAKLGVEGIKVEFERLATVIDEVELAVNGAVRDAFQGMFEDIMRGSKSAKQILMDFLNSISAAISKIAAQNIADQLFGSPKGGAGGIASGLMRFLGFSAGHRGGIIGQPTGMVRAVSPLAFLGAPRLHSGGMLGLRPGEVPFIGQAGEEILTRNDPRHSANGGGVTVNMTVVTPDAGSFRQSMGQIQAEMSRAVASGRRQL